VAVLFSTGGIVLKPPKRAFTISIEVGGDTWRDAVSRLMSLTEHVELHGETCDEISGSPSSNSTVEIKKRAVTHEQYFEEIKAYLKERKNADNQQS
jgi:hypothetical protein